MTRGRFIAFEGLDGSGKSTVFSHLARRLEAEKIPHGFTHEPTEGAIGKKIYDILYGRAAMVSGRELQRLYIEDRKEHIETFIEPALKNGMLVLCDRYWLSTLAYGMLTEPKEVFIELHRKILGNNFLLPDFTILLDLPASLAMERLGKSSRSLDFFEKVGKQERIRSHYLELASSAIDPNVAIIDAALEPSAVAESVWESLKSHLR